MSDQNWVDIGVGGGDRLQKIALIVPCYLYLSSWAYANHLALINLFPEEIEIEVIIGVYTPHAMRMAVRNLLDPEKHRTDWERIVVFEADMIMPKPALLKHALHTDDIVGSVYVQHAPPFEINAQWQAADGSRRWGHPQPESWKGIFNQGPALVKCDVVGLGCTSIARRVIDEWPRNQQGDFDPLMFWNSYTTDDANDKTTMGEVSHDVWFCTHARDLGFNVYLDTSIECAQRTEGEVTVANYISYHRDVFAPKRTPVLRGPGSEIGRR